MKEMNTETSGSHQKLTISTLEQAWCTPAEITLSSKEFSIKRVSDLPLYANFVQHMNCHPPNWSPSGFASCRTSALSQLQNASLDSFRVSTFFLTHAACYPRHALTGCLARFRDTTRECRVGWFFSESIFLVSKGKEFMLLALLAPHQLSSLTQINIVCLTCA